MARELHKYDREAEQASGAGATRSATGGQTAAPVPRLWTNS